MNWSQLLNDGRRKYKNQPALPSLAGETRTPIERDYDRVLFSTPVRRLADKTQVFPLDKNDSVRTRLTHSHEVSNLARSIGIHLAFDTHLIDDSLLPQRNVPALLAVVGLAHDLGNPPFGHEGEAAIQQWFCDRAVLDDDAELTHAMRLDFLRFEGNAQTFRLLTKLQLINDDYGLNLTYATLAALMKYPVGADKVHDRCAATKKHGFFQSERVIVEEVWRETGLAEGVRHPLTVVMEACDDIAYSVLDVEDGAKKGLVSFADLVAFMEYSEEGDPLIRQVRHEAEDAHAQYRLLLLSPTELNDISMQQFRIRAIAAMVREVTVRFIAQQDVMMAGTFADDLVSASGANGLCRALKAFSRRHVYQHKSVLEVELTGYAVIHGLMDILWEAIAAQRTRHVSMPPRASYVYQLISENYRRVFESAHNSMPLRYREAQLLTDMVSGMTDTFALAFYQELKQLPGA